LNTIFWDVTRKKIILRVWGCPALPKNHRGQLPEPPNSPKARKNVKKAEKTNAYPFPLIPIKGSLGGNEKNIGEKG